MKKTKLAILFATLFTLTLSGCGGNNSSTGPVDVVSDLTLDDTDYSSLPLEETKEIHFHYKRSDANPNYDTYLNWNLWIWDASHSTAGYRYDYKFYDNYGAISKVELNKVNPNDKPTQLGLLVAKLGGDNYASPTWYGKDGETDRFVDIKSQSNGGVQHVYLVGGKTKVFDNEKSTMYPFLSSARINNLKEVEFYIDRNYNEFSLNKSNLKMLLNDEVISSYDVSTTDNQNTTKVVVSFNNEINITDKVDIQYKFADDFLDSINAIFTEYFDSKDFIDRFVYDGNDLGVSFDNENNISKTTFKVWAPTSKKMMLNIYNTGNYLTDNEVKTYEMVKGDKGVFSYTVNEDLSGKYYTYTVSNSAGTNEVVDPYAKSAGVNGRRGQIVNFNKINSELSGWSEDKRATFGENGTDASIYEIHVRDMTINPNSGVSKANRGKFLGLTEKGTTYTENGVTVKTGLDHLKELGITHVQIQPFYDYSSVDESLDNSEMSEKNYNWGYDPQNYNVLEGSYSTDPSDGYVRIKEFKQMVMALHNEGINITMDVVYNHTASTDNSNFELLVPRYYHRTMVNGKFYNGSGCGNEMASERAMVRSFIRQSCSFWTKEYHLSGFRFDLMGLIDNQTMIDVYKDVHQIDDKALVYGEPWTGGTSKLVSGNKNDNLDNQQTVQSSLAQSYFKGDKNYVGAFNDAIRNAVRGDNSPSKGWVQNGGTVFSSITDGINGYFRSSENVEPQQVLNYVSCHDNYTLYDQLVVSGLSSSAVNNAYSQAETIIFTSQGVAFMQEGEDFMRSKNYTKEDGSTAYEHNSYNVGDYINDMDYSLKVKNLDMFNYFKKLVALRKEVSELTLSSRELVNKMQKAEVNESNTIKTSIGNDLSNPDILVYHASGSETISLNGNYTVLLDNTNSLSGNVSSLSLIKNQSVILRKVGA